MIYEWLRDIKFIWPENFILLGFIPFLIWYYIRSERRLHGAFVVSTSQTRLPATFKTRFRNLPFVLRMVAITCLIISLARPQHQSAKSRTEGEGIDIVLCMDVSGSMAARDVKPSRLGAAKEVAIEFVKRRPVDRIGLVVFSGESFTKCPITPDKKTIINQIQSLDIRDGGYLEQGTLIGEGLAMAVNRISKGTSKSRVIILLTDGKEDAPETRIIDPLMAIEFAKASGVKVYSIGMGGGVENAGEQMAPGGGLVRDYIDEGLLKDISAATGGRYYRATDMATLAAIYSQIDRLERSKVEVIKYEEVQEMFIPLVLIAMALLMAEIILRYTWLRKFP